MHAWVYRHTHACIETIFPCYTYFVTFCAVAGKYVVFQLYTYTHLWVICVKHFIYTTKHNNLISDMLYICTVVYIHAYAYVYVHACIHTECMKDGKWIELNCKLLIQVFSEYSIVNGDGTNKALSRIYYHFFLKKKEK